MLKGIVLSIFTFSCLIMSAQASLYYDPSLPEVDNCKSELVTTFSKYFVKNEKPKTEKKETVASYANKIYYSTMDNIIDIGKTFLGIPYRWGGTTERGFDCSGFIQHIFDWFGIRLPRTSREMAKCGNYVSKDELQKGDLLFFTGRNSRSRRVGHIGIVVEVNDNEIQMMHSSSSRGVHIEDLNKSPYFKRRYITARRLPVEEMKAGIY